MDTMIKVIGSGVSVVAEPRSKQCDTPPAVVPPSETTREPESEPAQDIQVGSSPTPPVLNNKTTSMHTNHQ